MTKIEAEKESKKRAAETAEELEVLGQDNEVKAAKWVIEKGNKDRKKEDEKEAEVQWKLDDKKKQVFTYTDLLLKELRQIMFDWEDQKPLGYKWAAVKDKKGLCLWIRDATGKYYAKGIKVSFLPKYDLNAISRMVARACDFMDSLEEKKNPVIQTQQPNIILP